jgi:hypothetical protein
MSAILQLTKDGDECHVAILPSGKVVHFLDKIRIPSSIRRATLAKLDEASVIAAYFVRSGKGITVEKEISSLDIDIGATLTKLGQTIYKSYIPPLARDYLRNLKLEFLEVSTNDVEIPWELMHDGDNFLCLKYAMGRAVQTKIRIPTQHPEVRDKITILFISDPLGNLPQAQEEVKIIVGELQKYSDMFEIDILEGKDASIDKVVEKLLTTHYEVIHYAGHVEYNADKPEESVLLLYDNGVTAKYVHNIIEFPPVLVFMNACSSAKATSMDQLPYQGELIGLGDAFIASGVSAYIGALWPIHDKPSAEFAITFYKSLAEGKCVGVALREAKRTSYLKYGRKNITWAAFILYGDPRTKLLQLKEQKIRIELGKSFKVNDPFERKIEFGDQVAEVINNIRRAFNRAQKSLGEINLRVVAEGELKLKEDFKKGRRMRVENFTLEIYGDRRSAAEFLKKLAQIHIFWYEGYSHVDDPVKYFLKINKDYKPVEWWKVPGIIDHIEDILNEKI